MAAIDLIRQDRRSDASEAARLMHEAEVFQISLVVRDNAGTPYHCRHGVQVGEWRESAHPAWGAPELHVELLAECDECSSIDIAHASTLRAVGVGNTSAEARQLIKECERLQGECRESGCSRRAVGKLRDFLRRHRTDKAG